jgi:hypothetical protein
MCPVPEQPSIRFGTAGWAWLADILEAKCSRVSRHRMMQVQPQLAMMRSDLIEGRRKRLVEAAAQPRRNAGALRSLRSCLGGEPDVGQIRNENMACTGSRQIIDNATEDANRIAYGVFGGRSIERRPQIVPAAIDDNERALEVGMGLAEQSVDLTPQVARAGAADSVVAAAER